MKTATLTRKDPIMDQRRWTLSEPIEGYMLVITAMTVGGMYHVFGCDHTGICTIALDDRGGGCLSHEFALQALGYTITAPHAASKECPCGIARVVCEYHGPTTLRSAT